MKIEEQTFSRRQDWLVVVNVVGNVEDQAQPSMCTILEGASL